MIIQEIIKQVKSGVCKIEFYLKTELVNSGSGFLYKNKLITNSHVFHPNGYNFPPDTTLKLVWGDNSYDDIKLSDLELIVGSDESNADYAVYDISKKVDISKKFNFEIDQNLTIDEGDDVVIFGFPFETKYLTTHYGKISAIFEEKGIKKIQIDASVNQGNSGGPLYHLETNKVIGIVTRKQAGLSKNFDDLLNSFAGNIEVLKKAQQNGSVGMFGINPLKMFEITQTQMSKISENIKRSANTGIGYAFSCEKLLKEAI
jgi:S1-C subfamily serine protease